MGKRCHASIGKVQDDKPRQDMGGGEMYIRTVEEVTATLHPENGEPIMCFLLYIVY